MAFTYENGYVPESRLVTFRTGWLPGEGAWKHQLPPATYRKHLALVALAKKNTGRDLKPTDGWSCYRPRRVQEYAKRVHGIYAATPGASSHGLLWEGRQCAAVDYGNWSHVYAGNRAAFFRDVRAVGLTPDLISPRRGYPDEPWHVVDLDPWAAVPAGSGSAFVPEEDDMFTDDDRKKINSVFDAIFSGGNSMKDSKKSISQSLAELQEKVGPIFRGGKPVSLRQEVADIKTTVYAQNAAILGMEAALTALATSKGVDPAVILKAAQDGVERGLRNVTFTASIDS